MNVLWLWIILSFNKLAMLSNKWKENASSRLAINNYVFGNFVAYDYYELLEINVMFMTILFSFINEPCKDNGFAPWEMSKISHHMQTIIGLTLLYLLLFSLYSLLPLLLLPLGYSKYCVHCNVSVSIDPPQHKIYNIYVYVVISLLFTCHQNTLPYFLPPKQILWRQRCPGGFGSKTRQTIM